MNLNPFIILIDNILNIYRLILTIWIIMGWLLAFDIINRHQPLVRNLMFYMSRLIEPVLTKIRQFIPALGGIDLSAIILFLLINLIKNILFTYFYKV
jgi:YggT family protein